MLLPVFVILGERRAGTSSLTARLGQHPGIFMLPKQDRGYFVDDDARLGRKAAGDWDETHSVEEYSAFFAEAGADPGRIAPEKSADYLFWRPAHERLNRYLPKARSLFFEPAAEQRMSRETRASLEDLYRPHIAALGELLDRSFSEWVLGAPGT